MNCFIASALGYDDVDAIYDNVIFPTLERLGIKPLRVDRVEHNDDIDKKIFQLLDNADLCIADLTYARPSVYYEAGYAAGLGKPVIYLVRKDHLGRLSTPSDDNLRMHFDLQMKNIIPWTSANHALEERLRRRLMFVLGPWRKERRLEEHLAQKETEFAHLSPREQAKLLAHSTASLFRRHGFSEAPDQKFSSPSSVVMRRIRNAKYQDVQLFVHNALTVSWLRSAWGTPSIYQPMASEDEQRRCKRFELCLLIVTMRNARQGQLSDVFPTYRRVADRIISNTRLDGQKTKVHAIALIDGVRSEPDLRSRLKSTFRTLGYL